MTPIALELPEIPSVEPKDRKVVQDISYANFLTTIAVSYLAIAAVTLTGLLLLGSPELFSIDPQAAAATITARVGGGIIALIGMGTAYLSIDRLWIDRVP